MTMWFPRRRKPAAAGQMDQLADGRSPFEFGSRACCALVGHVRGLRPRETSMGPDPITATSAQVSALQRAFCKTVGVVLRWFEPNTRHPAESALDLRKRRAGGMWP